MHIDAILITYLHHEALAKEKAYHLNVAVVAHVVRVESLAEKVNLPLIDCYAALCVDAFDLLLGQETHFREILVNETLGEHLIVSLSLFDVSSHLCVDLLAFERQFVQGLRALAPSLLERSISLRFMLQQVS